MDRQLVEQLVSLLDEHCAALGDWTYMQAMVLLQQLWHRTPLSAPEPEKIYIYVGYGASTRQLCEDYERLTANHNRLKRRQKNARRQWKETEASLRQQVDELLTEVEYLSQRPA